MYNTFGSYLRDLRERRGLVQRRFALGISMDPSNYAKIERDEVPPPSEAVLARIAEGLGISVVDDEWIEFKFYADVGRRDVPGEMYAREDQVTALLPAFFAKLHQTDGIESLEQMLEVYKAVATGQGDRLPPRRSRGSAGKE